MNIGYKLSYTVLINIILVLLAMGTSILIGRMLNPEGMGYYKYIVTVAATIAMFSCYGLNEMLNVKLAKSEIKMSDYLVSALVGIVPVFLVLGSVIFYFLFYRENMADKPLVIIALGYCLFYLLNMIFQQTILSMDKLIKYQLFEMSKQFIFLVGAVVLYFLHKLSIINLFMVLIFANSIAIIYVGYLFFSPAFAPPQNMRGENDSSSVGRKGRGRLVYSRSLFKNSFQAYINHVLTFMTTRVDIFLLKLFVSLGYFELGLYTLALTLVEKLWLIPDSVRSVLYLELMNHRRGDDFVARLLRLITTFAVIASVAAVLLSIFLLPLVFGEKFRGSILPFLLLLPGAMFFCFVKVLGTYFVFRDILVINTYMTIIIACVNIIFCMILIPKYSYFGAAIAKSIAYIFGSIYHLNKFRHVSNIPTRDLLIVKKEDFSLVKSFFKKQQEKGY